MNLVSECWIPVINDSGKRKIISLEQALTSAHRIRYVAGSTPLETVAILRLLLAILYRAIQPTTEQQSHRLLRQGQFPGRAIQKYLTRWQSRLNLFDREFPFFQWAHPPENLKPRNANRLFLHFGSGIRGTLHSHTHDNSVVELTPAQATRAVLTTQYFSVAGGNSGRPGRNFTHTLPLRQANLIIHGRSLFETLWLMLFPVESISALAPFFDGAKPAENDMPVWERDHPEEPPRSAPQGVSDSLTYPSRLIQLQSDADGVVRSVIFSQSLSCSVNVPTFDPMVAHRAVTNAHTKQTNVYQIKMPGGFLSEFSMLHPEGIPGNPIWPVFRRWLDVTRRGILDPTQPIFNAIGVETNSRHAADLIQSYNHFLPMPVAVFLNQQQFDVTQKIIEYVQQQQETGISAIYSGMKTLHPSRRSTFAPAIECFRNNVSAWLSAQLPTLISAPDAIDIDTAIGQTFRRCVALFPPEVRAIAHHRYRQFCKKNAIDNEVDDADNG